MERGHGHFANCEPAGAEGIKVLKQYRPAAMARSQQRYFDDVKSDRSKQCGGMAFRRLPTVKGGAAVGIRLNSRTAMTPSWAEVVIVHLLLRSILPSLGDKAPVRTNDAMKRLSRQ